MRRRARTDLGGGRSAMVVPTATVIRLSSRHPWKSPDMPCTEAHPDPEMLLQDRWFRYSAVREVDKRLTNRFLEENPLNTEK
jgi:hypothetical protein